VIIGLTLLVLGSRWLVDGAVSFARFLGVSELIVGLTIVAAGTSLPEVVTSIIAALRVSVTLRSAMSSAATSSIFWGCLDRQCRCAGRNRGFSCGHRLRYPDHDRGRAGLPADIFHRGTISRTKECFCWLLRGLHRYLILAASHHDALPRFSAVMLEFVIPITGVTLFRAGAAGSTQ